MIDSLQRLDEMLLFALNGSDSLMYDGIIYAMSKPLTWIPLYICLLYIIFKNNNARTAIIITCLVALMIVLADQGASGICKPYFHRLRPSHNPEFVNMIDLVNNHRGGKYGFFSSHAANTFALTVFITFLFRNLRAFIILLTYALVNCYTRVYMGLHYPSDIFVGIVYGTVCGTLIYALYKFIDNRLNPQRSFFSNAYSSTGYLMSDMYILQLGFAICMMYIMFRGLIYATVF